MSLATNEFVEVTKILETVERELARAASLVGEAIELNAGGDTVLDPYQVATAISTSAIGNSAGTGYAIGDTFTISGGTSPLAIGEVLTVDGGGAVLTYRLLTTGKGYSVTSNVATTHTLGSGTGLTINILTISGIGWPALQANIVTERNNIIALANSIQYTPTFG